MARGLSGGDPKYVRSPRRQIETNSAHRLAGCWESGSHSSRADRQPAAAGTQSCRIDTARISVPREARRSGRLYLVAVAPQGRGALRVRYASSTISRRPAGLATEFSKPVIDAVHAGATRGPLDTYPRRTIHRYGPRHCSGVAPAATACIHSSKLPSFSWCDGGSSLAIHARVQTVRGKRCLSIRAMHVCDAGAARFPRPRHVRGGSTAHRHWNCFSRDSFVPMPPGAAFVARRAVLAVPARRCEDHREPTKIVASGFAHQGGSRQT